MLIADNKGNQLLELITMREADLPTLVPLTHALVVARHGGDRHLLVFDRYRQRWELAGGMIEPGETPRACALRELREESGLTCLADALRFVGATKFRLPPNRLQSEIHLEYGALYAAEIEQLAPFVPNEEIAAVCWWDGREPIGEIAVIDQALIDLARLTIRPFQAGDRPALEQLSTRVFADGPPWNAPAVLISNKLTVQPELLLVAVRDDVLVGVVMAGFDGVRGWLYHLAVAPEWRRQGIATRLVRAAESGLRQLGCPKVNLQIRATNAAVVAFYQSLGYAVEERISMGRRLD